jgi:hypothetical protein
MPKIQPCRCTHGKTIHYPIPAKKKTQNPCGFPNCKGTRYVPKN